MQIGSYKIINSGGIQIDDIGFEVKSILRVCNIKGAQTVVGEVPKKLVFPFTVTIVFFPFSLAVFIFSIPTLRFAKKVFPVPKRLYLFPHIPEDY